jgi:hypothetical protein
LEEIAMTAEPKHPLVPADRVTGVEVWNGAEEKLGRIQDIAIDKVSGEVAYAIMCFGGFLGLGQKYHPVPWRLLKYDVKKHAYIVPLAKADLEKAPMIDANDLSGWNDALTRDEIFAYYSSYGVAPYWI